jgi:hypothetical protein
VIEGQPINFSHKIRIIDGQIKALYVLLPVPMSYNGVCYESVKAASRSVGLPAAPEIMNSGPRIELKTVL